MLHLLKASHKPDFGPGLVPIPATQQTRSPCPNYQRQAAKPAPWCSTDERRSSDIAVIAEALAVPVSVRPMSTACSRSSEFSQTKFCRKFKEMTWLGNLDSNQD